jgi:hypothetical protein
MELHILYCIQHTWWIKLLCMLSFGELLWNNSLTKLNQDINKSVCCCRDELYPFEPNPFPRWLFQDDFRKLSMLWVYSKFQWCLVFAMLMHHIFHIIQVWVNSQLFANRVSSWVNAKAFIFDTICLMLENIECRLII